MIDLRLGRYQDVLADVTCDALICDPPYGARTHNGQRHGRRLSGSDKWCSTEALPYAGWTPADVALFVADWAPRSTGWFCAMTSHDLVPAYADSLEALGRYVFAPIPCVIKGMNVRLAGDGPSSWCVWLVVSRPRAMRAWGTLPGAYVTDRERQTVTGGKPLDLMLEIVRDYSRPGDVVCDPCAGGATTLIAAHVLGRKAIGSEMDPDTHAKALNRIATSGEIERYVPSDALHRAKQARLFG